MENTSHTLIVIQTLGGIGLFLLGMVVMTSGLTALAGDSIRRALMRFTHSPLSGAITGAASTAIIQSSSATTVAAIGFVGAGLMSFPAALGIVFGANIGTTLTGWLVAILGFKLKLSLIVLPLIFVGMILKLFANERLANTGYAIAGFGVIFVGITFMQEGMQGLEHLFNFEGFASDSLFTRLQLVALGIIFTIVTQSSSAGVATALSALFAGLINFEQAAALVIGMDVGTTFTAAVATIGGSIGAKRTGLSHVIYNLFTAIGALILLTPYIWLWEKLSPGQLLANAEIALVAFHTTFNTIGVFFVLPFTNRFVKLIERLIPESRHPYSEKLDKALLTQPSLAISNAQKNIYFQALALLKHVQVLLNAGPTQQRANITDLKKAIDETHRYIDLIHLTPKEHQDWDRLIAIVHTLDHLQRLHERCEEEEDRAMAALEAESMTDSLQQLKDLLKTVIPLFENNQWQKANELSSKVADDIETQQQPVREKVLQRLASGEIDAPTATARLEAIRWLDRVSRHIARIIHHYHISLMAAGTEAGGTGKI